MLSVTPADLSLKESDTGLSARIQVMVRPDSFCSSSLISVPVRSALPALLSYFWSGRGAIYKSFASEAS